MIITVTLNPAIDKTAEISGLDMGSVNRIASLRADAGGKGINVSKVIKTLGGSSIAMGIIGGSGGDMIEGCLRKMGIETDFVRTDAETRVNLKIIDTERNVNTDINEPGAPVTAEILKAVRDRLAETVKPGDTVVLAGSAPKGAPADIYESLVRLCNANEAKCVLDVDGALLASGIKAKPYLIKPNIDELARLVGKKLDGMREVAAFAKKLIKDGIPRVVVSLGGDGALFCDEKAVFHAKGLRVPVRSTVGAGDSMVAALCVSMERGYGAAETMTLAMATSAANVTCTGTQAAEYSVIEPLMKNVCWEKIL